MGNELIYKVDRATVSRTASISLTVAERKWATWATEPMPEFWAEQVADGETAPATLPEVHGNDLVIPLDEPDAIEDLLYRLEEQAPDLAEQHPSARHSIVLHAVRSAPLALAEKVRRAVRS